MGWAEGVWREKATRVGISCRQVTGLCMCEEGKGLEDGSGEAGRAGEGSARITWHEKYRLCKQGRRGERPGNKKKCMPKPSILPTEHRLARKCGKTNK